MPGSIHVLVLEAFDLPKAIADDEEVMIKVAVGAKEFQTAPNKAFGRKTSPWSSDFVFPVLNLRDNLLVMLAHKNGEIISASEIDMPSIVEKGSFEVRLLLNGGGNIHLSLSFVLTDEERRRIDIMRAAALKRREQEALKSTGNSQREEKESENRLSDPLLPAPVHEPEEDIKKSESGTGVPLAASQESDEAPADESVKSLQGNHQGPSTGFEPGRQLAPTGQDSFNKTTGSGSISPQDSLKVSETATDRMNPNLSGTTAISSQASANGEVEEQTGSEESLGDSLEDSGVNHLKPSPSSVKAKIKAFETTRPEGAIKQGLPLHSTIDVHMSSPQLKSSPRRYAESEADQAASLEKHHELIDTTGTENEELDSANQVGSVEPFKSVSASSLRASEEKDCLLESKGQKEESNLGPAAKVDHVETDEREMQREKTLVKASKQRKRQIDLHGVSKQVLNGAIIGAVSGAVLIAAGALLWARNPNQRRNTSARQQISKQRRKQTSRLDATM